MIHAKFQDHMTSGSGEDDFCNIKRIHYVETKSKDKRIECSLSRNQVALSDMTRCMSK